MALLWGAAAQAHEGHDHAEAAPSPQPAPAAGATPDHAAPGVQQVELVAERRGPDVVLYLDDYATNAPLDGLQVSVRNGGQLLQAAPAGEGTYRIPGDLIDGAHDQILAVEAHGAGVTAQLQTTLPATVADAAEPGQPVRQYKAWLLALGVLLLGALIWAVLRRKRGAA